MHDFEYLAPTSLAEALSLAGAGAARFLAGGTDLLLALERAAGPPERVIDLKRIPGLDAIETGADGAVRLGALATMAAIAAHPALRQRHPALAEAARFVGGPAIRNRATLGGNLCNASPAADTGPPLLAAGATVEIAGAQGARELPLAQLWQGPRRSALAPGELLTAIRLPAPRPRAGTAFRRVTRSAMDIALANAAACVTLDEAGRIVSATLALGALGPTVIAVPGLAEALRGKLPDAAAGEQAAALARDAVRPIDDVRASAEYRRDVAGTLAARALLGAAAVARGGTP